MKKVKNKVQDKWIVIVSIYNNKFIVLPNIINKALFSQKMIALTKEIFFN